MVTVTNGVGNDSAVLNVSVLRLVIIRRIAVDPVTLGRPLMIEAVITGDGDFTVTVDFGDGTNISRSTAPHDDIVILPLIDSSPNDSNPVYLLKLQHVYTTPGDYLVSLTVGNKVSQVTNSLTANVADKELKLTLTADTPSTVASDTYVSLQATVSADDDVSFDWMCDRCVEKPIIRRYVVFLAILHCISGMRMFKKRLKTVIFDSTYC